MNYSLLDTTWFTLTWLNCLLSLVVLHHSAKVVNAYVRTKVIEFPGGYWEMIGFIILSALLAAELIRRSKQEMNKLATVFFSTFAPLFVTGVSVYRLWETLTA
jgi:hypothetical protein